MPVFSSTHVDIEYWEAGSADGTPVLMLHGFPDSSAAWQSVIQGWSGEAVRFIVPSQRGYGQSRVKDEEPTGEFAALADDALTLMDGLSIQKAVVVGHDLGARAAYALAALQPDRVQALIALASEYVAYNNSGILPHVQERDYWYQWFFNTPQGEQSLSRDSAGLCRLLWETWSPTWKFTPAEFAEAAAAWQNPQFVATVLSYYRFRYGNAAGSPRYTPQVSQLLTLPQIAAPTWFLTGLDDACNHPEGSKGQERWFSGVYERVELPGVGHFVHREAPQAVVCALRAALRTT